MFETSSTLSSDLTSVSDSVANIGSTLSIILTIVSVISLIVTIGILVKSILDRKKINAELSLATINNVKITAIILIVINALSIFTNCFAIFMLIMPIISVIFASNANSLLETNPDVAKSKANTASILNIISAILPICALIFSLGAIMIAGVITTLML